MARRSRAEAEPLNDAERAFICSYIASLTPVAADELHPMQPFAYQAISNALWRWTADAHLVKKNVVGIDRYKYDFDRLPHTIKARARFRDQQHTKAKYEGLRHEHAVPRDTLCKLMLYTPRPITNSTEVFKLLTRLCLGVIVTKPEDDLLSRRYRRDMPDGWDGQDPYFRYRTVTAQDGRPLFEELLFPAILERRRG